MVRAKANARHDALYELGKSTTEEHMEIKRIERDVTNARTRVNDIEARVR